MEERRQLKTSKTLEAGKQSGSSNWLSRPKKAESYKSGE